MGEVGKSSLISRLRNHAARKEWWSRALVIASASDEFNSAEIGWLEGRLYDVLNNAVAAEVMNSVKPGDDSLAEHEWRVLEKYVEPIMACLRACGAPPDTADQKPEKVVRRKMRYPETLRDLVEAGLLKPETPSSAPAGHHYDGSGRARRPHRHCRQPLRLTLGGREGRHRDAVGGRVGLLGRPVGGRGLRAAREAP